ncbi:hypothetical protein CRUP_003261 [Coryphaenoides rupestris]|nr:hypothetical protein CRUP_003261 [Coryphaenoides rupestris]
MSSRMVCCYGRVWWRHYRRGALPLRQPTRTPGPPAAAAATLLTRYLSTEAAPQPRRMEYQDAIYTLNEKLNSNAASQALMRFTTMEDKSILLKEMVGYVQRIGHELSDLNKLNIIHVTGTKGKGSTCAFTEKILRSQGIRTGFFSSPHLVEVRERIRINGQPLEKDLFAKYFWEVYDRLDETKHLYDGHMPSFFQFLTVMSFHVFLHEKVDVAIVEVGIGGTYDGTNIIEKPWVCGVSSLGIDHIYILGNTIEQIAWQKGGIFKPGVPAFTVKQPEAAMTVLKERAEELGLDDYPVDCGPLQLGLVGHHQRSNAALALQLSHTWLKRRFLQDKGLLPTTPLEGPDIPLPKAFTPSPIMTRVVIYNTSGERNNIAMLKLLLPCKFDFAVFCPNIPELNGSRNPDQDSFLVSVEDIEKPCMDNETRWTELHSSEDGHQSNALIFPCIFSALQWTAQGRDPVLPTRAATPAKHGADASLLREATEIHVLVTGSLHLVGGALKSLDPIYFPE